MFFVFASTSAAEWPMFQNDARGTGFTSELGPSDPEVKWRFDRKLFSYQSPVVDEKGNIYVIRGTGDQDQWSHTIYAVSPSGVELWAYEFPRSGISNLAYSPVSNTVLAVASRSIDEKYKYPDEGRPAHSFLLTIDSVSGELKRKRLLDERFSDPWVPHVALDSNGKVYATGRGFLYVFDADGEKLWAYKYAPEESPRLRPESITRPALSPDEKTVYVFLRQGGGLYAHDVKTGKKLWSLFSGGFSDFTSPVVGPDGTVYMAVAGDKNILYALTPEGKVKWKRTFDETVKDSNPVISGDGRYLFVDVANTVGQQGGYIYSLDPKSGDVLWKFELPPAYMTNAPALDAEANVYYLHGNGFLYSISPEGKLRYEIYLGREAAPGSPKTFNERQAYMTGLAIYDGRIYAVAGSIMEYGTLVTIGD